MENPSPSSAPSTEKEARGYLLAADPALGAVFVCDHCKLVHIDLGDVHFKTCLEGFQALVVMFSRAAANYEMWTEAQGNLT